MPYMIRTGPGGGLFDSAHNTDELALSSARRLEDHGRTHVRIIGEGGQSFSIEAFAQSLMTRLSQRR